MVAQWGVAPSTALHPVPVCVCLTDTSHTGCHCSLWVDWCSEWLMLAGSSVVLHVCCSTACPQVTFPCVCACAFVCGFEEDKDDMMERKKKKLRYWPLCVNQREKREMMRAVYNSSTVLPPPMFLLCFITVIPLSLLSFLPFPIAALTLSCQFIWTASSMASVYPLPSLTLALQGWPRLGKDAAAFIRPLAPSAPSHSPQSAVPSIAMATAEAVDGEGCLEWQPWQESGPSNDPGGKGRRKDGEEERRELGKGQCRYSHVWLQSWGSRASTL